MISLRLVYVLRIQDATKFVLRVPCLERILGMRFVDYNFETHESKMLKEVYRLFFKLKEKLVRSAEVNLVDPQRRLEDMIENLTVQTEREYLSLREALT